MRFTGHNSTAAVPRSVPPDLSVKGELSALSTDQLEDRVRGIGATRSGTQSLERAIRILRVLASRHRTGWRLSDLAACCGLDKSSTHRLLACLIRERLAQQRSKDLRYILGPLAWELGLSVPFHPELEGSCHERLAAVALRFDGIAFLMLRSGYEYVCALRAGHADLRAVSVGVGTRRPLITAAAGVSILLSMPAHEVADVRANNREQEMSRCVGASLESLESMYRRSEVFGFGVSLGDLVRGVHSVGVPVFSQARVPVAALCLAAQAARLPDSRLMEASEALLAVAPIAAAACAGTIPL
ncbi:IclR family transcriptional regulator [Caballeronia sp. HLA56]